MVEISKLPVITISREYHAGGRSVAKALSEELGIPWYDKDFVKLASEISGYSVEEIQAEGEEIGALENIIEKMLSGMNLYTSSHDEINKAEKDAVLELAKSPCIIVGRGAGTTLKEAGVPVLSVLLYADKDIRVKRCMNETGKNESEAEKYVEKRDKFRSLYIEKYTGTQFADSHNYTVCFDTGIVDYKKCTKMIVDILESLYE